MPNETEYVKVLYFGRARVRVRFSSDGPEVISFVVQLEALDDDEWKPIRRYDDHHGWPHRDSLDRAGRQYRKEWLDVDSNEALTIAIRDLSTNGERYVNEFLEGDVDGQDAQSDR